MRALPSLFAFLLASLQALPLLGWVGYSNAQTLYAQSTLYKYQDADGHWVFSDRKPTTNRPVETSPLGKKTDSNNESLSAVEPPPSAPNPTKPLCDPPSTADRYYDPEGAQFAGQQGDLKIENRGDDDHAQLYAVNNYFAPLQVGIAVSDARNLKMTPALPAAYILKPHSEQKIAEFEANNPRFHPYYRYQTRSMLGDPRAQPDGGCIYRPPLPARGQFEIAQAFNGPFSHHTDESRYAIDIKMPLGTEVHAARGGTVVMRAEDYVLNGTTAEFLERANSVLILHKDGTLGIYGHLQFRTIRVYPGDRVKAGDLIAKSGNTGFSTGPHLHFAILRNANFKLVSVPFDIATAQGPATPRQGMLLSNEYETENAQAGAAPAAK